MMMPRSAFCALKDHYFYCYFAVQDSNHSYNIAQAMPHTYFSSTIQIDPIGHHSTLSNSWHIQQTHLRLFASYLPAEIVSLR